MTSAQLDHTVESTAVRQKEQEDGDLETDRGSMIQSPLVQLREHELKEPM